jgi:nucleotide-binding universal stress UspA family protein
MIKRILVDLSDARRSEGIVRQATELASRHQAELTVEVEPVDIDAADAEGRTQVIAAAGWVRALHRQQVVECRQQIGAALEQLRRLCGVKGIPFSVVERDSDAFRSTLDRFHFHDLFICGTNARFDPACLESGSEELIRLVESGVRPIVAVPDEFRPVTKTLVALSRAGDSVRTLKQYLQLGAWPGAAVKIVTFEGEHDPDGFLAQATAYARRHGVEAEHEVLAGPMSQELLPHAIDCDAQLVALGNSDHSRLARWFFGGAVMEIIRESDRSLFLCQ